MITTMELLNRYPYLVGQTNEVLHDVCKHYSFVEEMIQGFPSKNYRLYVSSTIAPTPGLVNVDIELEILDKANVWVMTWPAHKMYTVAYRLGRSRVSEKEFILYIIERL